jgi:C4-type Zn-finger protein
MAQNVSDLTQRLVAWITQKHGDDLHCPICRNHRRDAWQAERVETSTPYQDPQVRYELVCQVCGYVLLFEPEVVRTL